MATIVLDNGSYELKVGFPGQDCVRVTNAITRSRDRRVYIGNDVANCKDFTGLQFRRPIERGQLYSWEAERVIWDSVFDSTMLGSRVDPASTTLILTEAPYSLSSLTTNTDQMVLEEYCFDRYCRTAPQALVSWNDIGHLMGDTAPRDQVLGPSDCCLVIDSGFSATNIVPVVRGKPLVESTVRVDVGGKLLTNLLKETVSFKYYNMMEESFILNAVKEQTCFVARDFLRDLKSWRHNKRAFEISYVLPDYTTNSVGRVLRDSDEARKLQKSGEQQVLTLSNERFLIPETLFNPMEIDLEQAGVHEAVQQSINSAPPEVQSLLWANIILTGGTSLLEHYGERIEREIRALAPQSDLVRVRRAPDAREYAWQGGSAMAQSAELANWTISRQDYNEYGESLCVRKFGRS